MRTMLMLLFSWNNKLIPRFFQLHNINSYNIFQFSAIFIIKKLNYPVNVAIKNFNFFSIIKLNFLISGMLNTSLLENFMLSLPSVWQRKKIENDNKGKEIRNFLEMSYYGN